MKRRDPHQWVKERNRDIYFQKAKQEGYRARSAYKLIEINDKYKIIKGNVLDLGAAPGAWLQVCKKLGAKVEGIDLLPIKNMFGVETLKADIFSKETEEFLEGKSYNTILSDIAPNTAGQRAHNHLVLINIAYKVLEFSQKHLQPGGSLCVKLFDGSALNDFIAEWKKNFNKTYRFKPKASNVDTSEFYLIGMDKVE